MTNDRIALDMGLATLTLQLTLNETFVIQALLNAATRTEMCLKIEFGQGPTEAEFVVSAIRAKVATP